MTADQPIKPPIPPVEPEYENVGTIPDQPHLWEWNDATGYVCKVCNSQSESASDTPDCLREQARTRNYRKRHAYETAIVRYEAQMDYYRAITGAAE